MCEVFEKSIIESERSFIGTKDEFKIYFMKTIKTISKEIFSESDNFSDYVAYCRQDYFANKENSENLSKIVYNVFQRFVNEYSR